MALGGVKRGSGVQEGAARGPAQLLEAPGGSAQSSECPVMGNQRLVLAHEACGIQGEDKCLMGPVSEPELQEEQFKLEEERLKPEVEALEERDSGPEASIVRSSHGPKQQPVKAEAELPQGLPLQRENQEVRQSEPLPSSKQHKKNKKRKSLGAPMLPPVASIVSAPSTTLGLERKAQRLRPLYQYINYCNPELNQAGEGDREIEAEVEPEWELTLVPEEAGMEQLLTLLPVTGELGSDLTLPCPNMFVPPTHGMVTLGEEVGEEPGGLPNLGVRGRHKTEVNKSTQVDIDKMLSVYAVPLVPQFSHYK